MDIKEAKKKYLFTTQIDLEDDDHIVLRELSEVEFRQLQGLGEVAMYQKLVEFFPGCIVGHSFTDGEEPAKIKDVADMIKASSSQFVKIMQIWMDSLPLAGKKDGKSGK